MDRSEGPNIAVGALLVGVAAVILGLLAPTAAAVVGACSFIIGGYMIVSVYTGWPNLTTAQSRLFRPRLARASAEIRRVLNANGIFVFLVRVDNDGRSDLERATVNLVFPNGTRTLTRCDRNGEDIEPSGQLHLEEETFWGGIETFPGRNTRFMFFKAAIAVGEHKDFQARLVITSPDLDEPFQARLDLVFPKVGA